MLRSTMIVSDGLSQKLSNRNYDRAESTDYDATYYALNAEPVHRNYYSGLVFVLSVE